MKEKGQGPGELQLQLQSSYYYSKNGPKWGLLLVIYQSLYPPRTGMNPQPQNHENLIDMRKL